MMHTPRLVESSTIVVHAAILDLVLRDQLDDFDLLGFIRLLEGPLSHLRRVPASLVVDHVGVFSEARREKFDGGISAYTKPTGKLRVHSGIHFGHLDLSPQLGGDFVPLGFELLAVAAPGCVEFDEPRVLGAFHVSIEGVWFKGNKYCLPER